MVDGHRGHSHTEASPSTGTEVAVFANMVSCLDRRKDSNCELNPTRPPSSSGIGSSLIQQCEQDQGSGQTVSAANTPHPRPGIRNTVSSRSQKRGIIPQNLKNSRTEKPILDSDQPILRGKFAGNASGLWGVESEASVYGDRWPSIQS